MARRKVTQTDLAGALGLSQQSISRRVNGALPFDVAELEAVAAFLAVPLSALLAEADAADEAYAAECERTRAAIVSRTA